MLNQKHFFYSNRRKYAYKPTKFDQKVLRLNIYIYIYIYIYFSEDVYLAEQLIERNDV